MRKLENFNESFTLFEHIAIKTTIKAWSELFGRLTVISFNDVLKKFKHYFKKELYFLLAVWLEVGMSSSFSQHDCFYALVT